MSEYKLFVGTACPHCRKVENFMEENNIEIQIVNINENRDAMKELIEKGGKRQVPCLFHDGEYMYESNDIIEFFKNK
ncbi:MULTISPECIES: glutaredoxin family protein [Anaerococcus]|uniref:glutaredoxin family protein n=1 Tax=Anaerococcus TaxID=165779 RepID=UPI00242DA894|nr:MULTISPECIES: glutathione S-transferase N-terminal domain-containing protein [Anaerococcus]MDD7767085.1 glutathione S-transferase N-terminal domain-containing protein [Anaerococcus vaginalis]MDY6127362.1 glutathione S-transferase N-terminal domain-containing protein [Anaerococcus sp.]